MRVELARPAPDHVPDPVCKLLPVPDPNLKLTTRAIGDDENQDGEKNDHEARFGGGTRGIGWKARRRRQVT